MLVSSNWTRKLDFQSKKYGFDPRHQCHRRKMTKAKRNSIIGAIVSILLAGASAVFPDQTQAIFTAVKAIVSVTQSEPVPVDPNTDLPVDGQR